MTSKRNENRMTTAKGIIANPYTKTFDEFEERINYTRSINKATEMVREVMSLDADVMISVTELVQDEVKRVVYNSQLVYENMFADYEDEETANENAGEIHTVIPYTMYEYGAQVWLYDKTSETYGTDYVCDMSPLKMTKIDARAFIRMSAEKLHGDVHEVECIGIHDDERTEIKRFAIVENDKLQLCVKEA